MRRRVNGGGGDEDENADEAAEACDVDDKNETPKSRAMDRW